MTTKPKTYVAAPSVPSSISERYDVVMKVLVGATSISEAARTLGMSRNHFQTLLHRGLASLIESLEPKRGGRPAKPPQLAQLQQEVERLRRENHRLTERVQMVDRLLGVASDLVTERVKMRRTSRPRTQRSRPPTTTTAATSPAVQGDSEPPPEEPDPTRRLLEREAEMMRAGLPAKLRAAVLGVSPATLRRWRREVREQRQPAAPGTSALAAAGRGENDSAQAQIAEAIVRDLHGQIGAQALSVVTGLSRRRCGALKQDVTTRMEAERKARAMRVQVLHPGVIRGFDAMMLSEGCALVAADAAVPFRTSARFAPSYDGEAVALALDADFEEHGAPLVLRLDQASAHKTDAVFAVLDRWGTVPLHGPPHHPGYYGQLERQNREHRAWLRGGGDARGHAGELDAMRIALNETLPRKTLGWRTAGAAWRARPPLGVDRGMFRATVEKLLGSMLRQAAIPSRRVAIEAALSQYGLLKVTAGERC